MPTFNNGATKGTPGDTYCLGGNSERKNIDVVKTICKILDEKNPRVSGESYEKLIHFVEDRKGHDFRYAIDDSYATKKLGYTRRFKTFEQGLESTINWYLRHRYFFFQNFHLGSKYRRVFPLLRPTTRLLNDHPHKSNHEY